MKYIGQTIRFAATDISNHLSCGHLTSLALSEVRGERTAPPFRAPDLIVIQQRGLDHEQAYVAHLAAQGFSSVSLQDIRGEDFAVAKTLEAMASGVDVIVQGALASDGWFGRPDILRRVNEPSNLGAWSYEPYDCKLSRETKAATILQLSHYAALLAVCQGREPNQMYVVPPLSAFKAEPYRVLDFTAYFRAVRDRLKAAASKEQQTYPEPNEHCDVCRWWSDCDRQRRMDDHLSLTAGITRLQRKQLVEWDVSTLEALSRLPIPIASRPRHGTRDGYARVREQARVQVAGRYQKTPVHELLVVEEGRGLTRLPEPSLGDLFFDLESDPFVGDHGREYLFGFVTHADDGGFRYERRWALTAAEEKAAFEWFVDVAMRRLEAFPAMHIYHFGHKEPSTLKALMGRYATREDEIDRMLRGGIFVDLHSITKQALRASVEQYSLKALEEFHGFARKVALEDAKIAMHLIEHGLELSRVNQFAPDVCQTVEGYNEDDCVSTLWLRDWLEQLRLAEVNGGADIPRPAAQDGAPSEEVSERQARVAALVAELTRDVPADELERTPEQSARWLLSNLLDWHRREEKVALWEKFRLRDLGDEELLDERDAIAGLQYLREIPATGRARLPVHEYSFAPQETCIEEGDAVYWRETNVGTVEYIDAAKGIVGIKKKGATLSIHPKSVYSYEFVGTNEQKESLLRFAESVVKDGVSLPAPYRIACDLLTKQRPRLKGHHNAAAVLRRPNESVVDAAERLVHDLDGSLLAIQGPPGAGKTYTAAHMIVKAIRSGKRVGVTANSHKVIRKLMDDVQQVAKNAGLGELKCCHKVTEKSSETLPGWLSETTDNDEAFAALAEGGCQVLAGTAWLWSREEAAGTVDLLFVDEAGQMSLANAIAIAPAAENMILLGDPQQLDQPQKGSHPDGADVSALEHLLDGKKTIQEDRGLFLDRTYRLHPDICQFTSEMFYDSLLKSRPGLENQAIEGHPRLGQHGLRFLPVKHEGNQNSSIEEVDYIESLVKGLLASGVLWVDEHGKKRQMKQEDILIVAPYNAQVAALLRRLPGFSVGTVDKFQGQQAPVVIYSLTTSSPEDAPRGMEFLYSLNRLNVATSRAKAMSILVGSPNLLEPECKTPRQLKLANALCRYVELAGGVEETEIAAR